MSKESEQLAEECRQLMEKGARALQSARRESSSGNYDFAASRAYYAVFYAMQAALLTKGITTSKHSGTLSEFGRIFLKTGVLPRHLGRLANLSFQERQIGDYEPGLSIDKDKAAKGIAAATTVFDTIRVYLIDNGVLRSGATQPKTPVIE